MSLPRYLRNLPAPPWSYNGHEVPLWAIVGKPQMREDGSIRTFHVTLVNTKTNEEADTQQIKAFMDAVTNHLAPLLIEMESKP